MKYVGATVKYGATKNLGEYNSARADLELILAPGELGGVVTQDEIREAEAAVKASVHGQLGIASVASSQTWKGAKTTWQDGDPKAEAPKTPVNPTKEVSKSSGTPSSGKTSLTLSQVQQPAVSVVKEIGARVRQDVGGLDDDDDDRAEMARLGYKMSSSEIVNDDDILGQTGTPADAVKDDDTSEITNGQLAKQIGHMMNKKNTDEFRSVMGKHIQSLIDKYSAPGQKKSHVNIPQYKRQGFLNELSELKA